MVGNVLEVTFNLWQQVTIKYEHAQVKTLLRFEYSESIGLQNYGVAKVVILTIFQQQSTRAHMFCYYCVKYYFNIKENFNCPIHNFVIN